MKSRLALILACLCFVTGGPLAQGLPDPSKMAVQISEKRAENRREMREYSWTRRTEIANQGEPQLTKLELVRFDIDGRMQATTVSEQKPEMRSRRGVRGRIQKSVQEQKQDWFRDLNGLLQQYSLGSTPEVIDFLESATFGRGDRPGTVRILGANVVKRGDELTMVIDADTKEILVTKVQTHLGEDNVIMETNHDRLPSGLGYQARSIIRVPSKEVRMTVENFNYEKQ